MIASLHIVQSVDDDIELTHEVVAKVVLLNAAFQALNVDSWILRGNCLAKTSRFGEADVFTSE